MNKEQFKKRPEYFDLEPYGCGDKDCALFSDNDSIPSNCECEIPDLSIGLKWWKRYARFLEKELS